MNKKINFNKFLLTLFLGIYLNISATTYYITATGSGTMNGVSWTNAASGINLQTIINNAIGGDQIWVSCGTYKPTQSLDRSISFSMKNGVEIYGSFIGTENTLEERDLSCNYCSILSGEIGIPDNSDNSYVVISNQQLDNTALLDGFVIRDGNNDQSATTYGNGLGGGIYNHGYGSGSFCHPTIQNCLITSNNAMYGGGAFNNGYNNGTTEPTYINCIFYQNNGYLDVGGMDSYGVGGNASPTVINCIFYGNTSGLHAGGLYAWGGNSGGNSHPILMNCLFANNTAINGSGGAIVVDNMDENGVTSSGSATVTAQNCIIVNNTASIDGPQFYVKGTGAQFIATYSNIDLTNQNSPNLISGNGIGNIDTDPQFINLLNPLGNDQCWLSEDDGLQLQSNSPCIDLGSISNVYSIDIMENQRISGVSVDMGPYEYWQTSGLLQLKSSNSIAIYPNPVVDWITLEGKLKLIDQIEVVDISGKTIIEFKNISIDSEKILLNLNFLEPGIYTIKANNINRIIIKK